MSSDDFGPPLPPHLLAMQEKADRQNSDINVIGPALPSDFVQPSSDGGEQDKAKSFGLGNSSESDLSDSDPREQYSANEEGNEDLIGPMPVMAGQSQSKSVSEEMEERARKMKDRLEGKEVEDIKAPEREAWMLELPDVMRKEYGLTKKTAFNSSSGPGVGDQSVWTDTPADKERKAKSGHKRKKSPDFGKSERDKKMEEAISEFNKGRSESLLELHRKKLKKEAKKAKKAKEKEKKRKKKDKKSKKSPPRAVRVPFDRDNDLKVNKFDKAMKDAYIKRSQGLTSRFDHGKQKFV